MEKLLGKIRESGIDSDSFEKLIKLKMSFLEKNTVKEKKYRHILAELPLITPSVIDLNSECIRIGLEKDMNEKDRDVLYHSLMAFKPWRKGPFDLFGIQIDSEWCSNLKWNRVIGHIGALTGKRILDIGSSSGYYMFRSAHYKPEMILGLEPYLVFYYQYSALQRFIRFPDMYCIPARFEEMPVLDKYFDTVFCMGILYHCRSPVDTLKKIYDNMKKGGELILETLIIKGEEEIALFPRERYAKMGNIYFIPTVRCLKFWLNRAGFKNIRCVDIAPTTSLEQRRTSWMDTESLEDFLDPNDSEKTVEGYPAPVRSVVLANAG